jgi:NAD+ synthase
MNKPAAFSPSVLNIECEQEVEKIAKSLRQTLMEFKRKGLVLGISGGIDSSVSLALCARAVGKDRVLALQMPERHSAEETLYLSGLVADHFGVQKVHEDITATLEAVGFYRRYDEAVRSVVPEYSEGWKSKIVIPSVMETTGYNLFSIVVRSPDGREIKKRLTINSYLSCKQQFLNCIRKLDIIMQTGSTMQ